MSKFAAPAATVFLWAATAPMAWGQVCDGGDAGGYACEQVDLISRLPLSAFRASPGAANDLWGFRDLNTDREYILLGLENGTAVVDVTDPGDPFQVARVAGALTAWRDMKLYQYYDAAQGRWQALAYVSADGVADKLVVIDLSGLPNRAALAGRVTDETSAHNVVMAGLEPGTGIALQGQVPTLMTTGSNLDHGALRLYSLEDPANPALLFSGNGHSHDAGAVVIRDERVSQCPGARDFCVVVADANEDDVVTWDVTDPAATMQLGAAGYDRLRYVHSVAWSDDGRYLAVQDELDEVDLNLSTTARIFDMADLANPALVATWQGPTRAIDHNGLIRGDRLYLSNYTRGLTVLDLADPLAPAALGYLDSYPASDATAFAGAWGVYPYLPSGTIAVSDIQGGLFLLRDRTRAERQDVLRLAAGHAGGVEGGRLSLEVPRPAGSAGAVSVAYETVPGSAQAGDYTPVRGVLSWGPGEQGSRQVELELLEDGEEEGLESFFLRLHSPVGADAALEWPALARVYVSDAGALSRVALAQETLELEAEATVFVLAVHRLGSAQGAVSVGYRVGEGDDALSGTLAWEDGDGGTRTRALALGDIPLDAEGGFSVSLVDPVGAEPGLSLSRVNVEAQEAPTPAPTPPPPPASGGGGSILWMLLPLLALSRRRPGGG